MVEKQGTKSITFAMLPKKYMAKHAKQRDPHTVKHLLPYFGQMKLAHMPMDTVEDYIVDRAESEDNPEGSTLLDVRCQRGAEKMGMDPRKPLRWRYISRTSDY